jgi:hypothetical protein
LGLGRGLGRGAPPQDALAATQRWNGRAFSSLTARGGGLPVGVRGFCIAQKQKGVADAMIEADLSILDTQPPDFLLHTPGQGLLLWDIPSRPSSGDA